MEMEQYCIYLRKSRADAEAEARGEGETLSRHEHALLELAKQQQRHVTKIYREIVSGETIAARPVMQQLLADVETGLWAGVLVMEIERLARGDTIDQGLVAQIFKYSGTSIITPMKTYHPDNEFDEEYFEFGLFMSRREYKTINRRLQRGRTASVKEGKYTGSLPPYGYQREKLVNDKGYTLAPNPEQAAIVRMIFGWYTASPSANSDSLRMGSTRIARRLNQMKVLSPKGGTWSAGTILQILHNPVYIGKIRWHWRPEKRIISGNRVLKKRLCVPFGSANLSTGLHEALISTEQFSRAQELLSHCSPSAGGRKTIQNPLAGLLLCGECGHHMTRHLSRNRALLVCPTSGCQTVSCALSYVEKAMLCVLRTSFSQYSVPIKPDIPVPADSLLQDETVFLKNADAELQLLTRQLSNTHDLLEQGIYSADVFQERSHLLQQRIDDIQARKAALPCRIQRDREEISANIEPKCSSLFEIYDSLLTEQERNQLLRLILDRIVYIKKCGSRWGPNPESFELTLYPFLPPK
ncbi:MAG: recombinase family protein [Oscillospiraceae bacterium]|jgi:DNA invertase Pin-like site-specific DNA recombinase|nr:recombinase family protein [Oscillospiraceae bacterium]